MFRIKYLEHALCRNGQAALGRHIPKFCTKMEQCSSCPRFVSSVQVTNGKGPKTMKILSFSCAAMFFVLRAAAASATLAQVPMPPIKSIMLAQSIDPVNRGLSAEEKGYMRRYSVERHSPSVQYDSPMVIGDELQDGVTYYSVEGSPSLSRYRYTVLNDRTVVVDPQTRRIVEVIE